MPSLSVGDFMNDGNELTGYRIIMAIGGSISAYRTPDMIREFRKRGAHVIPVVSNAASKIIGIDAIQWAADEKPITELTGEMEHINLFQNENEITVLLVCPATYNQIGKMANGIADSVAETFFANAIGTNTRIVIVPAMHLEMYHNKIMERNLKTLMDMGVLIVEPRIEEGKAKIMWHEEIIDAILSEKQNEKSILIVSGKSHLEIDPVRSIINKSRGATGVMIAREAYRKGYRKITLIGNAEERIPLYCEIHDAVNVDDFYRITEELVSSNKYDDIIFPAALSDFNTTKSKYKISGSDKQALELKPREKLISIISSMNNASGSRIVRFKLSQEKLSRSDSDSFMTVINYVGDSPYENGENHYDIFIRNNKVYSGKLSKCELAEKILVGLNGE